MLSLQWVSYCFWEMVSAPKALAPLDAPDAKLSTSNSENSGALAFLFARALPATTWGGSYGSSLGSDGTDGRSWSLTWRPAVWRNRWGLWNAIFFHMQKDLLFDHENILTKLGSFEFWAANLRWNPCPASAWFILRKCNRFDSFCNPATHCCTRSKLFFSFSWAFRSTAVTSIHGDKRKCVFRTHHSPATFHRLVSNPLLISIGSSFEENSTVLPRPSQAACLPRTRRPGVPWPLDSPVASPELHGSQGQWG